MRRGLSTPISEQPPTAQIIQHPKTPIRAAGQFPLPLAMWIGAGRATISGQSRILF